jgi:hypothetical protein
MATEKTKKSVAAAAHAAIYTVPFALITSNIYALLIICVTHFVIDRFRLARYVVWLKNGPWHPLTSTGYPDEVPAWLSVWLLIIADNTIHIIINGAAILYFV